MLKYRPCFHLKKKMLMQTDRQKDTVLKSFKNLCIETAGRENKISSQYMYLNQYLDAIR